MTSSRIVILAWVASLPCASCSLLAPDRSHYEDAIEHDAGSNDGGHDAGSNDGGHEDAPPGSCGNGAVDPGEECDTSAAGCSDCTIDCDEVDMTSDFVAIKKGGSCYFRPLVLPPQEFMYGTAHSACIAAAGADLASIGSKDELADMGAVATASGNGAWVGATDEAEEGVWVWETGGSFDSTLWGGSSPNQEAGNQYDCAFLAPGGASIKDAPCDWSKSYVCERSRESLEAAR